MEGDSSGAPPADADGNQGREAVRVGSKRGRVRLESNEEGADSMVLIDQQASLQDSKPRSSYRNVLLQDDIEAMLDSEDSEDEDRLLEDFESDEDEFRSDIEGPYISLTRADKERIRKPWRKTLTIKLLGRDISYTYLCNRVKQLWSLKGEFQAVDLDNGYYCFKFSNKSDHRHVLSKGPWIIADHYLTIRRWSPGFRSDEASIDSVAAWIRLPGMPLEFYDKEMMSKIGNLLGKTLKIDRTTSYAISGKFVRMCVELDLTKPLVPKIYIGGRWQRVEYEGLHMLCFHCGKFGHGSDLCPVRQKETEGFSEEQVTKLASEKKNPTREHESTPYGLWMVAKKTYRRNSENKTEGGTKSKLRMSSQIGTSQEVAKLGSRFYILAEEGNTLDNEEFVIETVLRGDTKKVLNKPKKIVAVVQKKQNLKESLQEAATVSNRNPTPSASKGTLVTSLVPKTVSSEIDIKSNERIQTRENNVALMGSSGMAIQRNSQAPVEIALASQTRMETIPITASFLVPQ
ncbi:PREDICTED: uncharacterized protein LOC18612588 [Theobroma cacao]|uniref:Uncharacterized protein LOC18612588 n=1 Tax=Theobroma cacao TaxID=3641 RepID=A0AB32W5R9_THECC|nr:PREDICTED: uncharacterized protein LOC18612588 [Theobroma cacao]